MLLYVGDGSIKLKLQGSGTATLDYGNPWRNGKVKVYLNGVPATSADANTPSRKYSFDFKDGDILKITEYGVMAINNLHFDCGTSPVVESHAVTHF